MAGLGSPRSLRGRAAELRLGEIADSRPGFGLDQADTDKRLELAYGLRNTRAVSIARPARDRLNGGLETLAACGLWTRK